ncbi:YiiX/YebB-like N1pC/P60 family cysteine hydrolase [Xylanibacter muris]|uniref:YiiX/YebB-like N1pC/P60 family cysteine hydrolase n=1 Tax=Xylanibacter muris TaxID=2736290 RepID=UPI0020A6AD74|nr:YiiX/YebB-like N1pC/P60 family cysteine hydrolase [Xylanibacter muris]
MKRFVVLFIILAFVKAVQSQTGYIPREGDLLFQVAGDTEFSDAIANATAVSDSVKFVHVAMVVLDSEVPHVIEAVDGKGVISTPLEDFLSSSHKMNGKPGVVAMRVNMDFPVSDAVSRAKSHLGEDYDWSFMPDNGKMYCSELIYESYRNADGTPIFTARPMNFRDSSGNIPDFWVNLFNKMNQPVPEGVLGTNPHDMSKDPVLLEVYRFFMP